MRVLIGAFGSRGDVQPMLALAEALVARGHTVALAVPPSSLSLAREVMPEAHGAGADYEGLSRAVTSGRMRDVLSTFPVLRSEVDAHLEALEPLAAGADLIAGSSVSTAGAILGERLHRPYAYFAFSPQLIPSGAHPTPMVRGQRWPRWVNRLSWALNEQLWTLVLKETLARARRARGLRPPPATWSSLLGHHPVVACDPALAGLPADGPVPAVQTGALFLRERRELSPEVSAFLERGPPPVYVGFGSMGDPDPPGTTRRLLESVRRAGVRAMIARGWAGLGVEDAPPDVLFIGPEPHGKLFPRCAAVVHHGGAGTTHTAARAGVPQVLVPHILDQFYWTRRVALAGIGPGALDRWERDPEPLARAIRACTADAALRERARTFAARMMPDGTDRAVELLERLVEGAARRGP
jgi:UDP:flavonoid glycosyltransferase YjiC (YdhE family)